MNVGDIKEERIDLEKEILKKKESLLPYESWILSRLAKLIDRMTEGMEEYTFSLSGVELLSFIRDEFAPNRYELKSANATRKLSHRETVLLTVLTDHKNTIVSRKDVLLRVWGDDSFFNSRNLDVYITKLRDYLKEDSSVQIVTVKGVGYHFVVQQ
jgi:DNA-binding response OmpR family regulator